jgi:hypothetical protein
MKRIVSADSTVVPNSLRAMGFANRNDSRTNAHTWTRTPRPAAITTKEAIEGP